MAGVVPTLDVNQSRERGSCGVEREGKGYILQVGVLVPSRKHYFDRIVSTRRIYDGLKYEITLRVRLQSAMMLYAFTAPWTAETLGSFLTLAIPSSYDHCDYPSFFFWGGGASNDGN